MSSRDEEWWDLQAGELVLGTLDDHERDLFESIRKRDPEFQYRITQWETRFAPLDRSLNPETPPEHVWQAIESNLGIRVNKPISSDSILNQTAALEHVQDAFKLKAISSDFTPLESQSITGTVHDLTTAAAPEQTPSNTARKINIWRDLTLLASTACLILGMIAWNAQYEKERTSNSPQALSPQYDVISVVLDEQSEPLWVVNAATNSHSLRVSALETIDPGQDKAYQLWMIRADNGVSSMGLLPVVTGKTVILDAPELSRDGVEFAVSQEPEGGSSNATPTGSMLFKGVFQKLNLSDIYVTR